MSYRPLNWKVTVIGGGVIVTRNAHTADHLEQQSALLFADALRVLAHDHLPSLSWPSMSSATASTTRQAALMARA